MEFFWLSVGLFLLIKGADIFVDGASSIAARLRIPSLIIGLTVVSFGTSAPEAAISISASISGSNSISLGNIIGSNIFNLLIAVGLTAIVVPLRADEIMIRRDIPMSFLAVGALAVIMLDGMIAWYESLLLLAALGVYLFTVIRAALKNQIEAEEGKKYSWALSVVMILGGLAAVVFGGDLVVDNAKSIAASFGMSETLIGLTVVALGTSLPELVTSLAAARKGESGIAIGNAVGSCLFNIFFILGITGVIKPINVESELLADVCFLALISALVYILAARNKRIGRFAGIVCVGLYGIYSAYIIMRA